MSLRREKKFWQSLIMQLCPIPSYQLQSFMTDQLMKFAFFCNSLTWGPLFNSGLLQWTGFYQLPSASSYTLSGRFLMETVFSFLFLFSKRVTVIVEVTTPSHGKVTEKLFGAGRSLSASHTTVTDATIGFDLHVCLKICKAMRTLSWPSSSTSRWEILLRKHLTGGPDFPCVVKMDLW